ncbi:MetQ/NlpA family ABC transporter substrate-binding protein [Aerococcaceae bacterium zg-ZJ1578]|uniref:MetQ/NlpA family ABC transporter substrate-binding protein n=1 Tax=Aerococcaceae TaxID=186827 RepID=UPI0013B741A8|nr:MULTISPECIES: MetQ/NlpA family ABC transporter substrate-binding protein [unclassified Facklamia]MBK0348036.1 MetQ/NlpA family ABC transporter substrate-binding protein [Aerococcaceae bacterium zg-1578]MBR7926773.1 MetQ/NlpA family ABC transporter substrate-binding protein [Aerococcaceae bacterium zg-ZUI334]MBS4461718.1 MetQ/NlpA family ABC transporter substrate-binding protein [Aerococcaceae bacterium zg-B36]QQD65350.1 MetQ/NlpA family ABC transporter substrate-binding protein [Aerococcacea
MKNWIKFSAALLAAGAFAAPLVSAEEKSFEGEKVTVGLVSGPAEDVWKVVSEKAAKDGIEIEVVLFTDYNQPNEALQNGSIDLNAFQHVAFLNNWNDSNKGDLTPLGFTFVSPFGIYSNKVASLDELQDGATIAIPNDPTNGGRAILALQLAGIIEVDQSKGVLVTPNDITSNPKNLKFEELDAAQLAAVLPDVDAAAINTNFATDAGLKLSDAIFVDADYPDKLNEAYKNVIAAKKENAENPLFKKIVEYYQTEEVAQALFDTTNGGDKPAWENAPVIKESKKN